MIKIKKIINRISYFFLVSFLLLFFIPYFLNHIFAGRCEICTYDYTYCTYIPCNNPQPDGSSCNCSSTQCCQANGSCGSCGGGGGCEGTIRGAFLDYPPYQVSSYGGFFPSSDDIKNPSQPPDTTSWTGKYIEFCSSDPYKDDEGHHCAEPDRIFITDFSLRNGFSASFCGQARYCDCEDRYILYNPPPNYEFPALLTLDEPESLKLKIINYYNYRGRCKSQDDLIGYFIRGHTCDNDRCCRDSYGPVSNYHCQASDFLNAGRYDVNNDGVINNNDDIPLLIWDNGWFKRNVDWIGYSVYYDDERHKYKDKCTSGSAFISFSFTAREAGYYSFAILSTNGVRIGPPAGCEHCIGYVSTGLEESKILYGGKQIRDLYFNAGETKTLTAYVETDQRCAAKLRVRVYKCPEKNISPAMKPENIGKGRSIRVIDYITFYSGGGRIIEFQWKFRPNFTGSTFLKILNWPFPNNKYPDGATLSIDRINIVSGETERIYNNIRGSFTANFDENYSYIMKGSGWNYLDSIFTILLGFNYSYKSIDGDETFIYLPVKKPKPSLKVNFFNESNNPVFIKKLKQLYVLSDKSILFLNYEIKNVSTTTFYYDSQFKIGVNSATKFGFLFSQEDKSGEVWETARTELNRSGLTDEVSDECLEESYCYKVDKWETGNVVLNVFLRKKPPVVKQLKGSIYTYNQNKNSCSSLKYPQGFSINIQNNTNPQYFSYNCLVSTSSNPTYSCTLTFLPKASRYQNLSLITTSPYYSSSGYWTLDDNCGSQILSGLNLDLKVLATDSGNLKKDIFVPLNNWFKTKDTSFSSISSLNNFIPQNPLTFDSEDKPESYLIISSDPTGKESGIVSSINETLNLGSGNASKNNWTTNRYTPYTLMVENFFEYVKSRKDYKVLTNLNNINEIDGSGIYYYNPSSNTDFIIKEGDELLAENSVLILGEKVKLIIKSSNFNLNEDNTVKKSIAFIADEIEFNEEEVTSSYQKLGGIFITKKATIKADNSLEENKPLKIKGNLIVSQSFINQRLNSDLKPSLFVVFDINQYMNLFPYLSIAKYDWQQKQ